MPGDLSQSQHCPFIRRFLGQLPGEVACSFTPAQLDAVRRAFGMRYAMSHAVDLRRTVRLPWGRFYLVLIAGRDRPGDPDRPHGVAPYLAAAACAVSLALAILA